MCELITSKTVTTRKDHPCFGCGGIIPKGTFLLEQTAIGDSGWYRIRTCKICQLFESKLESWEFEELYKGTFKEDERWHEAKRQIEERALKEAGETAHNKQSLSGATAPTAT
jgi:hypothetical protein